MSGNVAKEKEKTEGKKGKEEKRPGWKAVSVQKRYVTSRFRDNRTRTTQWWGQKVEVRKSVRSKRGVFRGVFRQKKGCEFEPAWRCEKSDFGRGVSHDGSAYHKAAACKVSCRSASFYVPNRGC